MFMAKKKVGLWLDTRAAAALDKLVKSVEIDKGDMAAAAIMLFDQADTKEKARALKAVLGDRIDRALLGVTEAAGEVTPPNRRRKAE